MFLFLTEIWQQPWFIIVAGIACLLLAFFLILFLSIGIRHQSLKRQVRELESRYNSVHDTFSTDCSNMIKRVEAISKNNANYVSIFDSVQERFAVILKDNDKQCYITVDSLKKQIGEKDYKDLKPIIDSAKLSMDSFARSSEDLSEDLQTLLKPEEECRSLAVAMKEKFRSLKDRYAQNATALDSLSDSFNMLFSHISEMFSGFEDMLNMADYKKARELLPEAEKLIDATDKVMKDLPYLNTMADKVIPERIEELSDTYHELEKTDYPLHHLMINSSIDRMRRDLAACKKRLSTLSIKGVQDTFNAITMQINGYFNDFEKEKEAKRQFDKMQINLDSITYQTEKQFANLRNSLPQYKAAYLIDQTYLAQIDSIKDMIDDMSAKKRMLDTYINSSTKQPYSMLVTAIEDLQQRVKVIQKAFDSFHSYLRGLKADTDRAYVFVRKSYEMMRKTEYELRKANIDVLTEITAPRLQLGYRYINGLDRSLKISPINVVKLNEDYKEAKEHLDRLYAELDESIKLQARAEDLIVYDNKYREDSLEARQKLEIAEAAFLEADFSRAATTAANIYKEESARSR